MDKFIPYEKLSKKQQKAYNARKRRTWSINPVTRRPDDPKAYKRKKTRKWDQDDPAVSSFFMDPAAARI